MTVKDVSAKQEQQSQTLDSNLNRTDLAPTEKTQLHLYMYRTFWYNLPIYLLQKEDLLVKCQLSSIQFRLKEHL